MREPGLRRALKYFYLNVIRAVKRADVEKIYGGPVVPNRCQQHPLVSAYSYLEACANGERQAGIAYGTDVVLGEEISQLCES